MIDTIDELVANPGPPDPYTKHLIRLYSGDFERLGQLYATKRPNEIIRQLVREHIDALEKEQPNAYAKHMSRARTGDL
jgi:hypothetical protein